MTLPTPTPEAPKWLIDAAKPWRTVLMPDGYNSVFGLTGEEIAQNIWDALTSEGSIWWSDTGDRESNNLMLANSRWNSRCEPVLVVPLARHNPNQAAT